jgi:putative phosphoribosyl transferase
MVREAFEVTIMRTQFLDRTEAGKFLAKNLGAYVNQDDVLVLALPRGGVPVAAEVAKRLNVPLDVFVVRKLGVPEHPELAMGAIASGGVRVINRDVVEALRIPDLVSDAVAAQEQEELARRERAYRDDLPSPDVEGKTVILVDDGIATGSTMLAAVAALRQLKAARIVVAAPVVAGATYYQMRRAADDVAAVMVPDQFRGVGEWYEDFSQTTDDEVRQLLAQASSRAQSVSL